ncbi:MAG: DUF58 domain-containing protein [Anaerolineae bacterium]|nr:DUF58 domain-containing protein [Anaerolineae bacterium]
MQRRRNAIYLIIGFSLLSGLITGRTFFFNVTYVFAGLLVLSFIWAWNGANWLRLTRQTRARRAQVGRYVEERFAVRNTSVLPKLWLEIYDHSDLPGHFASQIVSNLGSRAMVTWIVRTLCIRRGEFLLGPLRVVASDPFGLFEIERKISATSKLVVYPATVPISDFALPSGLLPGGEALRRRTHHITTNASGVRDYVPGDSFSRIHWRSTARRDRLVVKEFELDPLADIWIVMDAERIVHAGEYRPNEADAKKLPWEIDAQFSIPPTTEEYAVTAAASLAHHFLRKDRTVGFVTCGQHHESIQADRGGRQITKILETLAVIRAQGTMPLEQLLTLECNQLAQGTTVIVVTPSTREGWTATAHRLLRRGLRVIGVLIDPESFGGRPGMKQTALHLNSMNIPTYVVKKGDNPQAVLSHRFAGG